MKLLINIRGTSGSGKSTLCRQLLEAGAPISVINCDRIATQEQTCRVVKLEATRGIVVFEGLLISGLYSRYVQLAAEIPTHHFIFAFLDTPLATCIERVLARRAAKGNTKPFDPNRSLIPKYRAVQAVRSKLLAAGKDVRDIDHTRGCEVVRSWLSVEVSLCAAS
jgi:adenylate kinase family enzyme